MAGYMYESVNTFPKHHAYTFVNKLNLSSLVWLTELNTRSSETVNVVTAAISFV